MNEEEIRQRIKLLEERKEGYLEVGKSVSRIENEIYKWEVLLAKLNKSKYQEEHEKRIYYQRIIDKATNYINNIPESDDDYVSDYIFNIEDKEKMLEILKGE